MARRKKKSDGGGGASWLVTFSDLMTLLLTFFVLLLSMSSMDRTLITKISAFTSDVSHIEQSGHGKVPDRIRLVLEILREPHTMLEKQDRIKDLLFPNDILPVELSPGTLEENLRVLAHPEGVVIVLTEAVLFPKGEYKLTSTGQRLLNALVPFLHYTIADVALSGHTDKTPTPGVDPYVLSGRRALSALEYFLNEGMRKDRFSVGGYGPDKPFKDPKRAGNDALNRRIEILVKTQRVASY